MANVFQRLFSSPLERDFVEAQNALVSERALHLATQFENERLEESMRDLSLYLEDLNWIPVSGWEEERGFSLDTIKEQANRIRPLLAVNPTIKKAINARVGYIWGRGVTFKGDGIVRMQNNAYNKRSIFDEAAKWKLEAQLATDGNIWTAKNSRNDELTQIPIEQLAGWVLDENDPTRVLYWLRKYSVNVKNFSNGVEQTKYIEVFYPAHDNTNRLVNSIDGIAVDKNMKMIHLAVNRQEGWILGLPDIMAAMFWAKAHKELFESGTTYVKAQGKFASKVVSKTSGGAQSAAARIAQEPRRDINSGEVLDIGGTAILSGGMDMQLMGKMSGGVDFDKFDPVAGLIAAGLDIPVSVLIGNSDTEEKSLEQTTVDAMKMRQKTWSWYFMALFGENRKIEVVWPKIRTEPEYRRLQSVEIANNTNVLHRAELRQLTLEGFGLEGDPTDLPDIAEQPDVANAKAKGDDAAKHAEKAAKAAAEVAAAAPAVGEQGVTGKVGKLSTGGDAKASRNSTADRNTKNK